MAEIRNNEGAEPSGNPWGTELDEAGGPTRNRAATGAREADSPHAAGAGWQPGPGATDFLGLEPDVNGGSAASGPTESWLFDIEHADAGAPPQAQPAGARNATQALDEAPEATDAEAADADLALEAESDAPPRRQSRRILVGAAVLACATIGGWYAWDRYGQSGLAPEVATVTPKPAPAKPAAGPKPTPTAVKTPVQPEVAVQPPVDPTPAPVVAVEPPTPILPEPAIVAVVPDATTTPTTDVLPPVEPTLVRSPDAVLYTPVLPEGAPGPGGGRHATDRDYAGMWLEPTIPNDAIRGPTRLRTLNVGLVRAGLQNGEYVEGNLHAVGESRIWLDVQLGRISLAATDVRELTQIVGAQGAPMALGNEVHENLPRVEVLLPGGSLTGRVLGRDGDRVTFVTDDGMRMRVDAIDVRPAPKGRSRLIGPVAARQP